MRQGWREELADLHRRTAAGRQQSGAWEEVSERARRMSSAALALDAMSASMDEIHDATLDQLQPEVAEALARISPDFDLTVLEHYSPVALAGLGNAVKGALFELQVQAAADAGGLQLPEGVAALRLVDDFANPAFDAEVLDANGDVIDVVQLKASSTADIVAGHLADHPDIAVWATHEAAVEATERGIDAVDTGLHDTVISRLVTTALMDQAGTSVGEILDELVPQITYGLIAARAGWRLLQGESPDEVIRGSAKRAGSATVVSSVAAVVSMATGTDLVRIPVVLAVSVIRSGHAELDAAGRRLGTLSDVVQSLATPAAS